MKTIINRRAFMRLAQYDDDYDPQDGEVFTVYTDGEVQQHSLCAEGHLIGQPGVALVPDDVQIADWPLWAKKLANKWALKRTGEEYDPFDDVPTIPFPASGFPPVHRGHGVSPEFWEKVRNHGKRIGRRHRLVYVPHSIWDEIGPTSASVELVEVEK